MEENGLAPSAKKEIRSPQNRRAPRNLTRQDKKKKIISPQKNICWVYTMEKKDTNTDYQKVVWVGDQSEIVETTFGINFLFGIHIYYFWHRVFKSHLKKSPPT